MTDSDRGLSLGTGATIAIVGVVIVIAIVLLGAAALGGGGGPADVGTETTTTTAPPTSTMAGATTTEDPGSTTITKAPTSTTETPEPVEAQFEQAFRENIEAESNKVDVIDLVTRENTVYVTAQGPNQGGVAHGTLDDFIQAYTDTMQTDWADDETDWGIDHAVISLYAEENNHHWFNARIEESWTYRYYTENVDLEWVNSNVFRTTHLSDNTQYLQMEEFQQTISTIDGVTDVRSLEQYDTTYFLDVELSEFSGDSYNQTMYEISEAFWHAKATDSPVKLQYTAYAENGTALVSNYFGSGWADLWRRDEIPEATYRLALVNTQIDARQIPDGIGSMLTRIEPFPADGPGE